MSFVDLKLSENILRARKEEGYNKATPIQAETIPHILNGRDIFGCAQTGTGKTAAFCSANVASLGRSSPGPKDNKPSGRVRSVH